LLRPGYIIAKKITDKISPYELLKKLEIIGKPKIEFDDDYYDDPEITPEEDEPAKQPEMLI